MLEASLRALPLRTLGHPALSRARGLHPLCHSIPPLDRLLLFPHQRSRLRTLLASMGGITLGIHFLHQLPSPDVHILMRGRFRVPPYQLPDVHPRHDEPLTLHPFSLPPSLFLLWMGTHLMTLTQHSPRWLWYLDGTLWNTLRFIPHPRGRLFSYFLYLLSMSCSFASFLPPDTTGHFSP